MELEVYLCVGIKNGMLLYTCFIIFKMNLKLLFTVRGGCY